MGRVLTVLAEAVFPRFCVSCKREGGLLCRDCDAVWHPLASFPLLTKSLSRDHRGKGAGEVFSFLHYADPVARQLITAWKYQYDASSWQTLQRKLAPLLPQLHLRTSVAGIEAIVPVPLGRKRRCERGFDQAEEIARWLSLGIHLPVLPMLQRQLTFGHQADRTTNERQDAMANSPFRLLPKLIGGGPIPRRVLLVDDVWTTGATMLAAAAPLNELGIETHFFAVAKG